MGSVRSKLRNRYVAKIRKAKKVYFNNLATKNKKSGGIWRVLRQAPKKVEWELNINGKNVKEESVIAEHFKDSFCSKVNNLRKEPHLDSIFDKLTTAYPSPPSWDIPTITREDVLKCIDDLRPFASCGPDGISNKLIKTVKFELVDPLLKIINGSAAHGTFPDIWKKGYVSPIHKKGSRSSSINYRPVVLMSCLGKVLEAVKDEIYRPSLTYSSGKYVRISSRKVYR